jgi:hypothetical protein
MDDVTWATDVTLYTSKGRLMMHALPRALFDLIPGNAREHSGRDGTFWTKDVTLAGTPGKHVPLTVFCMEGANLTPPPSPIGEGSCEPLLREPDPNLAEMDALNETDRVHAGAATLASHPAANADTGTGQ